MNDAPLLTEEMLGRFSAAAAAGGLPVVGEMGPGIAADEQDALLKPLGLVVPDELRALWGWRIPSGPIEVEGPELAPVRVIAPDFELLQPFEGAELTQKLNRIFGLQPGESPWLVIGRWFGPHGYLYLNCSTPTGPCPVGVRLAEDPEISPEFRSLGAYVDRCIRGLLNGEYGIRDGELWADETLTRLSVWRTT